VLVNPQVDPGLDSQLKREVEKLEREIRGL